jgi:hypothetical protein
VLALAWLGYSHALATATVTHPQSFGVYSSVKAALGVTDNLVHEMVGVLGWLDTPVPNVAFYLWTAAFVIFLAGGLLWGTRRQICVLGALVLAVWLVPVAIMVHDRPSLGLFWQGRYSLPLAAGAIVIAGAMTSAERLADYSLARLRWFAAAVVVVGGSVIFLEALRRYTVGLAAGIDPFRGTWHPPLGSIGIAVAFLVVMIGWTWWLGGLSALSSEAAGSRKRGGEEAGRRTAALVVGAEREPVAGEERRRGPATSADAPPDDPATAPPAALPAPPSAVGGPGAAG